MVVSISTLPEMRPEQVALYLEQFRRLADHAIFLKQWRSWTNPSDGTSMSLDDYRLGGDWQVVHDEVDPVNPAFFNRIWHRG